MLGSGKMMIDRPGLVFDEKTHSYFLDGEKLAGVSTVAKVGEDDIWSVAAAWAFRIGYEGALEILSVNGINAITEAANWTPDELREALKRSRKTPWHRTDDAKERGTAIHDALEILAQEGKVPVLANFPQAQQGYVQALCRWFLDWRPTFIATEVQVVSVTHKFAGRFDILCELEVDDGDGDARSHAMAKRRIRAMVDLKTGKRIYPTSQFPQLSGYALAMEEMGFPPTDAQFVLNVHDDGSYDFERSNAGPEHFLAYLEAHRQRLDLKQKNKKGKKGV